MVEPHHMDRSPRPAGSESPRVESPRINMGYLTVLTFVAGLGGLLFGYDTAVISGAIEYLSRHFELDEVQKGWAASCALIGCAVGAGLAGTTSDLLGRRKVLLIAAVLFIISALGAAVPRTLTELVLARFLGGLGIGMASMMSPLYIAEVSPAHLRGRLVSINQFAIILGMLAVYMVNARIAQAGDEAWNTTVGWRWMFGSGVLPAVLFFSLLLFVPESPRWLVHRGRLEEARAILTRIAGNRRAEAELIEIRAAVAEESGTLRELFSPGLIRPLVIGVVLAVLQQITGINTVLYYAPTIFAKAGMTAAEGISDTVLIGAVNLLFTVVAIAVVDHLGRKPLLMIASAGMGLSLVLLGRAFVLAQFEGRWVLIWVLVYVASFAVAMGPVVWVVISEIFPNRIRGRAMSIATVHLWVACFLVSQFFPVMLERMGGYAFYMYAAICGLALVFVAWQVPETRNKTLEEIERSWRAAGR